MPYRHPLVTAKLAAGVDVLSRGRLILGIGIGWMEDEFTALGMGGRFDARGRMTDEDIAIMRAVWREDVASFHGEFYSFDDVSALPRPVQQPHPPIWVGGNGTRALRRVVRLGTGWHPIAMLVDDIAAKRADLDAMLCDAGRDPADITVSLRQNLRLAESEAEAKSWRAPDPREVLAGTADAVIEQLRAFERVGVRHLVLSGSATRGVDGSARDDPSLRARRAAGRSRVGSSASQWRWPCTRRSAGSCGSSARAGSHGRHSNCNRRIRDARYVPAVLPR